MTISESQLNSLCSKLESLGYERKGSIPETEGVGINHGVRYENVDGVAVWVNAETYADLNRKTNNLLASFG